MSVNFYWRYIFPVYILKYAVHWWRYRHRKYWKNRKLSIVKPEKENNNIENFIPIWKKNCNFSLSLACIRTWNRLFLSRIAMLRFVVFVRESLTQNSFVIRLESWISLRATSKGSFIFFFPRKTWIVYILAKQASWDRRINSTLDSNKKNTISKLFFGDDSFLSCQ